MGRLFVCPLVVVLTVIVSAGAFPQQSVDLLPNWMAGNNSKENYPAGKQEQSPNNNDQTFHSRLEPLRKQDFGVSHTTTTISPRCTASLDVKTHGNPNCPQDQQFFDMESCKFVCPSTRSPADSVQTSPKYVA